MIVALTNEIKRVARESVRKAIDIEIMRFRASLMPYVSAKEQRNIEKLHKAPARRSARTVRVRV